MSRVIKFRAWDGVGMSQSHNTKGVSRLGWFFSNMKSAIIMQYTGRHDEERAEVYEGDLVLVKGLRVCEVIWHEEAACWDLVLRNCISSDPIGPVSPASWKYNVKVIGNIHQHPELLNQPPHNRGVADSGNRHQQAGY